MNNAAASHLSMKYNLKGPTFTVSTACASSNHAMAQAFQIVRSAQKAQLWSLEVQRACYVLVV